MLIPIIPKDPEADGFSCRDGEIEFASAGVLTGGDAGVSGGDAGVDPAAATAAYGIRFSLTPEGAYPAFNVRIPLLDGEEEAASLMLGGGISRVDAAVEERISRAILERTTEEYSRIVVENRRFGLHLLPFRVYCLVMTADGETGYPSAQPVMLPSESPPHPEITASGVTPGCMTLSLRIPVHPCRLSAVLPEGCEGNYAVRTFVSYPVFIPDSDEVSGSLGSVPSASGGNALGVRFTFLSAGNMKSSVAAPEKYYRMYGNPQTGYRLSSKAAPLADYTIYKGIWQAVPPFATDALTAVGSSADPFSWIADWERYGDGCLPLSLPYSLRGIGDIETGDNVDNDDNPSIPYDMDSGITAGIMSETGWKNFILTRPMTFATAEKSRRNAEPKAVRSLRILGLPAAECVAVLLGSDDGICYEPLRLFDPHTTFLLLTPPRLFHRLLLVSETPFTTLALHLS